MVRASIVIVNFNTREHLKRCLRSLYDCVHGVEFEIIVVDNGSHDHSVEMIRREFPRVKVVEAGENLGFAKACNVGAGQAHGTYILLLNSDTELYGDAVATMVSFLAARADAGIVTSRLVYPDFSDQGVARSFPTPANALFGRTSFLTRLFPNNTIAKQYMLSRVHTSDQPFEVDWVSGACLMMRKEIFDELRGLDEQFFMYWEDADLCFRAKQKGWRVFCVPEAVVVHHEGKSSPAPMKTRLIIEFHKSVYRYYRKHHVRWWFSPWNAIAIAGLTTRAALLLMRNASLRMGSILSAHRNASIPIVRKPVETAYYESRRYAERRGK